MIREELQAHALVLITEGSYDDYGVIGLYIVTVPFCVWAKDSYNSRTIQSFVDMGLIEEVDYEEVWLTPSRLYEAVPLGEHINNLI
jgi:hypothetical protein